MHFQPNFSVCQDFNALLSAPDLTDLVWKRERRDRHLLRGCSDVWLEERWVSAGFSLSGKEFWWIPARRDILQKRSSPWAVYRSLWEVWDLQQTLEPLCAGGSCRPPPDARPPAPALVSGPERRSPAQSHAPRAPGPWGPALLQINQRQKRLWASRAEQSLCKRQEEAACQESHSEQNALPEEAWDWGGPRSPELLRSQNNTANTREERDRV